MRTVKLPSNWDAWMPEAMWVSRVQGPVVRGIITARPRARCDLWLQVFPLASWTFGVRIGLMGGKKTSLQNCLIEDNQGLVYHLASRIHRRLPVRHEFDDLVGYGMLGLAEAAKTFVAARGVKFSTFAFFRIRGAIFDGVAKTGWMSRGQYRRHMKRVNAAQEQSESLANDSGQAGGQDWDYATSEVVELTQEQLEQLADSDSTGPAIVSKDEATAILCRCVDALPRRECRLIMMVYFEGFSLQEAAERIGISKSWASRLHAKTLQRLGAEINRWNNDAGDPD